MVGWCLIPASICRSLGSFLSGKVTKYTGIVPVLIFGKGDDCFHNLSDSSFYSTLAMNHRLPKISRLTKTLIGGMWRRVDSLGQVRYPAYGGNQISTRTVTGLNGC